MYCMCEIPMLIGWGLQNMSFPINNWMKVVLEVFSCHEYYQFSSIQRNHLCILLQIVSFQALIVMGKKHSCPMTFAQPVSISLNLKLEPNAWFVSGFCEFLLGFSQHFIIVFFLGINHEFSIPRKFSGHLHLE